MAKWFLFLNAWLAMLLAGPAGAASGVTPARDSGTLLIVPARPHIVKLAFDVLELREITLVAYSGNADTAAPRLHVWRSNAWQRVSFPDFCAMKLIDPPPANAILIGDEQVVPRAFLQGPAWPGKLSRVFSMQFPDVVNELDKYIKFSSRERKQLADKYGLELKAAGSLIAAGPAQTAAVEKAAAADEQLAQAVENKPGKDFQLELGGGDRIDFIWIQALAIWVGKYEVTNAQYWHYDRAHDPKRYYDHILNLPDQPVVFVSWEDANNYCGWLNRNFRRQLPPGCEVRLPTEPEWLVFATAGQDFKYPWGNQWPPPAACNYRGLEGASLIYNLVHGEKFIRGHNDGFIVTAPVAQSGGNAWGLYGTGGNVWEWCQDWFDPAKTRRALRGAGWNNYEPGIIAATNRSDGLPEKGNAMIGFRVVVAPQKKTQN